MKLSTQMLYLDKEDWLNFGSHPFRDPGIFKDSSTLQDREFFPQFDKCLCVQNDPMVTKILPYGDEPLDRGG